MKSLFFSLLFLACGTLIAQPTLTSESLAPNIGDSWEAAYIPEPNFVPGPGGANQNWDFSDININQATILDFEILDPAAVPGASNFPTSSFVYHIPLFGIYEFYEVKPDSISLVGGVSLSNGMVNFLTNFVNPEDAFHMPLNYGDEYDYYSFFDQYLAGNYLTSNERSGTVTSDGYGTLKTPYGTYENILRVKIVDESFGIISTQYAWFDVNNFIPICLYENSIDPDGDNSSVYFTQPNVVNATENHSGVNHEWQVWYDSGANQIKLQLPSGGQWEKAVLEIATIDGRQIQQEALETGSTIHSIELPQWPVSELLLVTLRLDDLVGARLVPICY